MKNAALLVIDIQRGAFDGHRTWPSKTEPAFAISERVNQELKARGASLASTAALAQSLREPRT
jgi:nicotinamidase-related amidase